MARGYVERSRAEAVEAVAERQSSGGLHGWFVALGLLQIGVGVLALATASARWPGWSAICFGLASLSAAVVGFETRMKRTMVPMAFFFGIESLWLVLLARRVLPWLAWWSFAVGFVYLIALVASDAPSRLPAGPDRRVSTAG